MNVRIEHIFGGLLIVLNSVLCVYIYELFVLHLGPACTRRQSPLLLAFWFFG